MQKNVNFERVWVPTYDFDDLLLLLANLLLRLNLPALDVTENALLYFLHRSFITLRRFRHRSFCKIAHLVDQVTHRILHDEQLIEGFIVDSLAIVVARRLALRQLLPNVGVVGIGLPEAPDLILHLADLAVRVVEPLDQLELLLAELVQLVVALIRAALELCVEFGHL